MYGNFNVTFKIGCLTSTFFLTIDKTFGIVFFLKKIYYRMGIETEKIAFLAP